MQQIEIDFEVFKALTALRRNESHTYNEVIREVLNIDNGKTIYADPPVVEAIGKLTAQFAELRGPAKGFSSRGLFLPNGTLLRATYKGSSYMAQIADGKWEAADGTRFESPSAAASAITGNNVNGWRFWQAKRPSDAEWRSLDMLPKS